MNLIASGVTEQDAKESDRQKTHAQEDSGRAGVLLFETRMGVMSQGIKR